jgi:glycosyltransferase involved in cell wall biosynthesis
VNRRPRVVYWNNIPAPYMVERFNALAGLAHLDFEAWFNARSEPGRSWDVDERAWRFAYRLLPGVRLGGREFRFPAPLLARRPDLLVSLYAEPVFIAGWALARLRGSKTCFRVLMTHDSWVRRSALKDRVKRFLFRSVDAIETPGADGRDFAVRCGAAPEKVFIATHTVDVAHFDRVSRAARGACREALRMRLGLRGCTFIFVGRLWEGKGLEHLLQALHRVQAASAEPVSLLLAGDGGAEAALRALCRARGLRNVAFAGFVQKQALPEYHAAADVFVFPTLGDPYGLAVDEAMASGLPVISTSAAGEIRARVREGINGYVVPPADSAALAHRMLALARDAQLREAMGEQSRALVAGHTPLAWAEDFERMVAAVLSPHAAGVGEAP